LFVSFSCGKTVRKRHKQRVLATNNSPILAFGQAEILNRSKGYAMSARHTPRMLLIWLGIIALVSLPVFVGLANPSFAADDVRYFPETGHYLQSPFRTFWENNGGVKVFGYPISEEYVSAANGRVVQWFERARLELVTQNGLAWVEPAKLGSEITQGRTFPTVPPLPNTDDLRYFPETQHVIQKGFKDIWETYGGEPIFGLPLSEEMLEIFPDGTFRTVQYFERARFEYWPEMPAGERVLFTSLGRMLAPTELVQPLSPDTPPGTLPPGYQSANPQPLAAANTPTSVPTSMPTSVPALTPTSMSVTPTLVPTSRSQTVTTTATAPAAQATAAPSTQFASVVVAQPLPSHVNALVSPEVGVPGQRFAFQAYGFEPGERVGLWLTAPDQRVIDLDVVVRANEEGSLAHENISIKSEADFANGIWSINARGMNSEREAIGYFRIDRTLAIPPGDPANLGVVIHDQLVISEEAFVMPLAAPQNATFTLIASGYDPDEKVGSWVTSLSGESFPLDDPAVQIDSTGLAQVTFSSEPLPPGTYVVVAEGEESGVVQSAPFLVSSMFLAGPGTSRPYNVNGTVSPSEGGLGTVFTIHGQNLQPNEPVEFWMTEPAGSYTLSPLPLTADAQGQLGYAMPIEMVGQQELSAGVYGFHFRGKASQQRVDVYFTYTGKP
jgi:hypothetical protein